MKMKMKLVKVKRKDGLKYNSFLKKQLAVLHDIEKQLNSLNVSPAISEMDFDDEKILMAIYGSTIRIGRVADKMVGKIAENLKNK